jgi:hypothetical protein
MNETHCGRLVPVWWDLLSALQGKQQKRIARTEEESPVPGKTDSLIAKKFTGTSSGCQVKKNGE